MKALLSILLATLIGCGALTSKGEALSVRLYDPEHVKPRLTAATNAAEAASGPALELGRVSSGAQLREKILHRDGPHELGAYDDRRWTERPENYVRRELARTLFEERGFRHVLVGTAPRLDVEVLSFEEVRLPNAHAARIQLHIVLHNGRDVLLEETIGVDKPVPNDPPNNGFDGFVTSMTQALDDVAARVADRVKTAPTSSR